MALKAKVDVVIPVHNKAGMVLQCVEYLRAQPRLGDIILIDDGSEPDQAEALKNIGKTQVWTNNVSQGFISSVNRGVKKSQSPLVLILNSDAFALGGAIEKMANNLDDGAAVCGARLLFSVGSNYGEPGTVQHAGVGFNIGGIPYHPFMGMPGEEPCVTKWRSVNAVTGAAMMVRRDIWDKIGGFDTKYGMGVFEDVDYGLQVKKLGLEIIYEPSATFGHLMHGSQPQGGGWFTKRNIETNLSILFTKHGKPACDDQLFYRIR